MIDYNQLSPDSRVWVYQSNRPFNTEEIDWLNQQLWDFVSQWATHSNKVKGYGSIYKNQFIVLVADESVYDVSGCSTDSLMRFIKEIEKALNVNLFDRMSVACEINGEIVTMSSEWLGAQLSLVGVLPLMLVVVIICTFMTFVTEITSNMATTQLMMPILAAIAISTGFSPLMLMIPATFSASCAFMLPVATAPNMIVFGSERIKIQEMVSTGITLNLVGIIIISAMMLLLGELIL